MSHEPVEDRRTLRPIDFDREALDEFVDSLSDVFDALGPFEDQRLVGPPPPERAGARSTVSTC